MNQKTLSWVLRHQPLMLLVTLATIAFTIYLYVISPKGFFPQQDTGGVGVVQSDQNTSFQAMSSRLKDRETVSRDPGVQDVVVSPVEGAQRIPAGCLYR